MASDTPTDGPSTSGKKIRKSKDHTIVLKMATPSTSTESTSTIKTIHDDLTPIPEEAFKAAKKIIAGPLFLEIVKIVDTTQPSYSLSESGKHRVLMLEMTDGEKIVKGFEYKSMPKFSTKIPAGTKVKLTNVTTHNNVLVLDDQCIEPVGLVGKGYSGFLRQAAITTDGSGPPPFVPLQIEKGGAKKKAADQQQQQAPSTSQSTATTATPVPQPGSKDTGDRKGGKFEKRERKEHGDRSQQSGNSRRDDKQTTDQVVSKSEPAETQSRPSTTRGGDRRGDVRREGEGRADKHQQQPRGERERSDTRRDDRPQTAPSVSIPVSVTPSSAKPEEKPTAATRPDDRPPRDERRGGDRQRGAQRDGIEQGTQRQERGTRGGDRRQQQQTETKPVPSSVAGDQTASITASTGTASSQSAQRWEKKQPPQVTKTVEQVEQSLSQLTISPSPSVDGKPDTRRERPQRQPRDRKSATESPAPTTTTTTMDQGDQLPHQQQRPPRREREPRAPRERPQTAPSKPDLTSSSQTTTLEAVEASPVKTERPPRQQRDRGEQQQQRVRGGQLFKSALAGVNKLESSSPTPSSPDATSTTEQSVTSYPSGPTTTTAVTDKRSDTGSKTSSRFPPGFTPFTQQPSLEQQRQISSSTSTPPPGFSSQAPAFVPRSAGGDSKPQQATVLQSPSKHVSEAVPSSAIVSFSTKAMSFDWKGAVKLFPDALPQSPNSVACLVEIAQVTLMCVSQDPYVFDLHLEMKDSKKTSVHCSVSPALFQTLLNMTPQKVVDLVASPQGAEFVRHAVSQAAQGLTGVRCGVFLSRGKQGAAGCVCQDLCLLG